MCNLIEDKDNTNIKTCIDCGKSINTPLPIHKIHLICNKVKQAPIVQTPTLMNKVVNFGKFLRDFTEDKFALVKTDIADNRLRICESCDRLNKDNYTCKECSCFMKIKVHPRTSTCPLNKWPIVK